MPFQPALLAWFEKNKRPLPWRAHYRPYGVWISEIMLQQTQMSTVIPYYERWMRLFPDVKSLAEADPKAVLKAWEGLGYYSRARNLHATAKAVLDKHGGKFPEDFEAIRGLKGVGRYTAGAIASIAFNQERPIVDGNIVRVLARIYMIDEPVDVLKNREHFWALQESLIPKGEARNFNQALMELGALICKPENPACAICPARKHCRAYEKGRTMDYPVRAKKKEAVKVVASALVLEDRRRYLIRFRPLGEIMGGLWEFPEWKLAKNKPMDLGAARKKTAKLAGGPVEHIGTIKRNYTYFNETLHVFKMEGKSLPAEGSPWESAWAAEADFSKYPFSSAHAKIVKLIRETTI